MVNSSILVLVASNIPLCLFFLLLLLILRSYWTRSKSIDLSHLPGPSPLPVVGNALLFSGPSEDIWLPTMKMLRNKYGPVVRVNLGTIPGVMVFSPKGFEKILSSNVHITKGFQYEFAWPWLGQGLLTSTGSHWKTHRKLLTPAFHFRILEDFLHIMNDQAEILCSMLQTQVDEADEELLNVYPFITHCALDIICETAMGRKINCQSDCNSPYVKAVYKCQNLLFHRMMSPWLWNDFIFSLTSCGRNLSNCLHIIQSFTQTVIKERKLEVSQQTENFNEKVDDIGRKRKLSFLDLLIEASKDGGALTDQDIREEVDTFMFEGHDTTASNISLTLYLLAHHTEAQAKCHQELDEIFLKSDRSATSSDLNEMNYLHCCIKESLRLYGSVPTIGRTTGEPVDLEGYLIPANTEIYLNMAMLHRDPVSFPDPERFIPERFLAENEIGRHPYAYAPFSAGPRNCIGQKFAVMEEKAVISAVLRKFKLKTNVAIEDVPLLPELVLKPRDGLFVQMQYRK